MREILFRGKTGNGEWVEGLLWKKKYNTTKLFISCFPDKDDNEEVFVVEAATIGQFTGLTDKNGKKIFEGDIVQATISINDFSRDRVRHETGRYEIKYHTKHCYFYLAKEGNNLLFDGNWHYYLKDIEVIGNIHDNKELLGE